METPKCISIGISEILLAHSTMELYPVIKSCGVGVYVMTSTNSHTALSEKQASLKCTQCDSILLRNRNPN